MASHSNGQQASVTVNCFSLSYQHAECSWTCALWWAIILCINDGEYLNYLSSYHGWTKSWWEENGTFATVRFCVQHSSIMLLGKLVCYAGCEITRRCIPGTFLSLKCFRGWVSWLLLKYCIYCVSAPSLYREFTDSMINPLGAISIVICMYVPTTHLDKHVYSRVDIKHPYLVTLEST